MSTLCDKHAGFLPWLGASSAMLGTWAAAGLVLAAAVLVWRALS